MRKLAVRGGRRSAEVRARRSETMAERFKQQLEAESYAALMAVRYARERDETERARSVIAAVAADHHEPVEVARQERIQEREEERAEAKREAERQRLAAEDFEYRQRNMWAIARGEMPPNLHRVHVNPHE
jgi:hypothetical protein